LPRDVLRVAVCVRKRVLRIRVRVRTRVAAASMRKRSGKRIVAIAGGQVNVCVD
jgi:hypothetical protein